MGIIPKDIEWRQGHENLIYQGPTNALAPTYDFWINNDRVLMIFAPHKRQKQQDSIFCIKTVIFDDFGKIIKNRK